MSRNPLIRWISACVAGVSAALVLLGLLYLLNAENGFTHTTAATSFGWLIPIVTGVVTAAVAWALLTTHPHGDDGYCARSQSTCEACGGIVLGDWRLCPHCGQRLAEEAEVVC